MNSKIIKVKVTLTDGTTAEGTTIENDWDINPEYTLVKIGGKTTIVPKSDIIKK